MQNKSAEFRHEILNPSRLCCQPMAVVVLEMAVKQRKSQKLFVKVILWYLFLLFCLHHFKYFS